MALTPKELQELHDLEELDALQTKYKAPIPAPTPSTTRDMLSGAEQGVTFGFADELGAGLQTGLERAQALGHNILPSLISPSPVQIAQELETQGITGDIGPTSTTELYRQAQQENEAKYKEAQERSPWAYGGGEIGGAILSSFLPGGAITKATKGIRGTLGMGEEVALKEALKTGGKTAVAKELGKRAATGAITAAPTGALYGAGESEGKLIGATPEERAKLLEDTKRGAQTASILGALGSTALGTGTESSTSKQVSPKMTDSEFLRQLKLSYGEGKAGRGFSGIKETGQRLKEETATATGIVDNFMKMRQQLGQNIENTLKEASESGFTVPNSSEMINASEDLNTLLLQRPNLLGRSGTQDALQKLELLKNGNLDPVSANQFRREIKSLTQSLSDEPELRVVTDRFSKQLDQGLSGIKGYKEANQTFYDFSKAGPETLLSKGLPVEYSESYLSDKLRPKKELATEASRLVGKLTGPGTSGEVQKKTFMELIDGLKEFQTKHPGVLEDSGIDLAKFEQGIINQADLTTIRKTIQGYEPQGGKLSHLLSSTPRGLALRGANIAGKVIEGKGLIGAPTRIIKAPIEISKKLYNASNDELMPYLDKIENVPGVKQTVDALRQAITNKDMAKKNAALFALLQNKNVREALSSEESKNSGE